MSSLVHPASGIPGMDGAGVAGLIEEQCDNYACGTQDRRFLRDDKGFETEERELLRLNLEQFAHRLWGDGSSRNCKVAVILANHHMRDMLTDPDDIIRIGTANTIADDILKALLDKPNPQPKGGETNG